MASNSRAVQNIPERAPSDEEKMFRFADKLFRDLRVAMPARVVSFNAEEQTVVVTPLIREKMAIGIDLRWEQLPNLPDVPVQFPQAGDFVLTMPIQPGDEVLVVFNDMCIDAWWESGGVQNWVDRRRHDLSDAIAIPGINSKPNVIPNIADDAAELRTKNGDFKVRVKEDEVRLVAPDAYLKVEAGKITLSADDIEFIGDVNGAGSYLSHRHTGVQPGVGESGGVDT